MILKLITLLYEALDLLYYRTADNTSTSETKFTPMVEEIERLRAGLKPACPHWQQDGDGINEWRRCCTNRSYTIPEGGEPSEFCPDCGGRVTVFVPIEILDTDPNAESDE